MRNETYLALMNLKDELKNDSRIINLLNLEKNMEEDEEVILLTYKKDQANDYYNDMLRLFKEDSKEVKSAQEYLYLAKKKLEEHPKVREYLKAYQEVRMLLSEVSDILFSDFTLKLCKHKD